jgi:hypothetical protein
VAQNRPGDAAVLELVGRDLAREGAARLVEDVLRCDFEALAEVFACKEEVERGRGDDDLWGVGLAGWSACLLVVRRGFLGMRTYPCWGRALRCSGSPRCL